MAKADGEEERQPLLSHDTTDSTYGTSSTVTPTGNGSRSPKPADGDADVEANAETTPEDAEAQKKARKNVTIILPALALGVSFFFLYSACYYYPCAIDYRAQYTELNHEKHTQMFLAAADMSVVNANYGKIATDFESLELASWISTA